MSTTERKELFDALLRLRRAQRERPVNRDLSLVQDVLEERLGRAVSQRFAADALGVSHTALARWVRSGDLPAVPSAAGRSEIPVGPLAALVERVQDERAAGRAHVLEPVMRDGRRRAERLEPAQLLTDVESGDDSHDRAARRALAYHRALARSLRRADVDAARQTLWAWEWRGRIDPRYAARWSALLDRPVEEIRAEISADTPDAHDLRQNSPMAGLLTEPERRKILATVR